MTLTGAWGRMRNRFVGRGILDASMAHSVRGRQGCRPLRPGWSMVRTSGGTRRSRPTSGTVVCSWFGGNGKAAVRHPRWGGDGGFRLCRGSRHLRMALSDALEISPVATGDQRLCLWTPRFWAARRPLARVVAEEFCVRPRCGFAAILDVWQETAPQAWRKRPGEHRRHTGGGQPHKKKIE